MDGFDVPMQALGLSTTEHEPAEGATIYTVKGGTHALRAVLRELGGRWDGFIRGWIFKGYNPRKAICERVASERETGGLSDSLPQAQLSNPPYYSGHRQRLRDRFLSDTES